MINKLSNFLLTDNNMAYTTVGFLGFCIVSYFIFEASRYRYKISHHIPYTGLRFTTKNIAYISMMIAVSVSVTVVISITLPITVFPPIRVAFTGIMIKITGMFFGPIVGIIVGLITEMLCLMFVPSYIHVAYFLVSIGFGFFAGLSGVTSLFTGNRKWYTFAIINLYIIGFTVVMFIISTNFTEESSIFGFVIEPTTLPTIFIIMMGITLSLIWLVAIILQLTKKGEWLEFVLPVILLCIVTETCCTLLLASWGDAGFLGIPSRANGYISMVVTRLLMVPFKILFNTIVLTTVTIVLKPLIKCN